MTGPYGDPATTLDLLTLARAGEQQAIDCLIDRYVPELTRWASGRLPGWARHSVDTDDLVQESLIQVFQRMDAFEYRGEGALLAYLRQTVLNRIRNQIRWAGRRPRAEELDADLPESGLSPLEAAIGAESLERYEAALERLSPPEREALVGRLELGLTYPELARALSKPSADAARMTVARAMVRLGQEMRDGRQRTPGSDRR